MRPRKSAYKLLHDGALALADVQTNGMRIDVAHLEKTIAEVDAQIADIERRMLKDRVWRKYWSQLPNANLGSRPQLGSVLFGKLGHVPKGYTTKGNVKTNSESLEGTDEPIVKDFIKVEKLKKMKSTYLYGMKYNLIGDRIHPSTNLNTVRSYRSSQNGPNMQNIPTREELLGQVVRPNVIPDDGEWIVEIDYGQIEVRISACYHLDPVMITYIEDKTTDMHKDMACQIYKLRPDQVGKKIRYCGKNRFVFPQFYGDFYVRNAISLWEAIDEFGLITEDGIPLRDHLKSVGITSLGRCDPDRPPVAGTFEHQLLQVENDFWGNRFQVYNSWKTRWWQNFLRKGEFRMLSGFVVTGEPLKKNACVNYPIQGSSFHCLLWSLVELNRWLKKYRFRTKIINEIHDSLMLSGPKKELKDVLPMARYLMTEKIKKHWPWIVIPLEVEAEGSPVNWFEKRVLDIDTGEVIGK